ncbi:MAG: hypothetical protein L6Q53_04860 [Candidatus Brocadia sinica]|nr:hypothetical protein [Candidatus Brocadia sinica]
MFQHMVNYLKDRVTNGNNCSFLPTSGCKPSVLGREISLFGMAGSPGRLIQGSAKPSVAFWRCTTFSFAVAFIIWDLLPVRMVPITRAQ